MASKKKRKRPKKKIKENKETEMKVEEQTQTQSQTLPVINDPVCKELRVVLDRIDETDLSAPFRRKRKSSNDQEILDEYIDCIPIQNEYYKTYESSAAPLSENVFTRIEIRQSIETKIIETKNVLEDQIESKISNVETNENIDLNEISDVITIIDESDSDIIENVKAKRKRLIKNADANEPIESKNRNRRCAKCPSYKIISETNLAVDAFRFGDIDGIENYFLTHFHADHYIGLKRSFSKNLYLSEITGLFVETFIKVDRKFMHFMLIHTPIIVDDVEVTALDANQ